jgi:hypothetical protein
MFVWPMAFAGPMFRKYNAVLRGFPKAVVDDLKGNTYATTIHLIVSGVIKLSRYPIRDSLAAWDAGAGMLMVATRMCGHLWSSKPRCSWYVTGGG